MLMQVRGDLIPLVIVVLGGTMVVIIMLFHGFGLDRVVVGYKRRAAKLRKGNGHPRQAVFVFAWAIFLMLLLHITEIGIWGLALCGSGLATTSMRQSISAPIPTQLWAWDPWPCPIIGTT